jgi:hypothetical protein
VIIGRGAAAIPFTVGPLALAGVLAGLVMADDAARACPEQPVVTGKMPGDTADDGRPSGSPWPALEWNSARAL